MSLDGWTLLGNDAEVAAAVGGAGGDGPKGGRETTMERERMLEPTVDPDDNS